MKVLHLITRLDPGGSAENTLLTCQRLVDKGWEAPLASGPGQTGTIATTEQVEVPVTVVPNLLRDPSPFNDLRAFAQIYKMLRRQRPDILHTHSAKAGILGRWAGWLAGVGIIVHTPHGHVLYGYASGIKNRAYLLAERCTAPITDCLVALSEGERRESAEARIGRLTKWVVIPSGVDFGKISPRQTGAAAGQPVRIGVVARLAYVKGIDVLVRAAARLADAGVAPFEVLVWGDGELREELVALSHDIGVDHVVDFVGTSKPVQSFLAKLDVYAQPSRNEGMGRALVLAQASGLPVVASRVCGIPDVVQENRTGLLVEPEDPAALADALARLMEDAGERTTFGAAAREWINTDDETGFPRFSLDAMLWRLERLYERLADNEVS